MVFNSRGVPNNEFKIRSVPNNEFKIRGVPNNEFKIPGVPNNELKIPGVPNNELKIRGVPNNELKIPGVPNNELKIRGMQYLEQKRFVHRDLACRNLLLSSPTLVKITDFGLSRATGQGKDYYTAQQGGKWPLKWYAPESINYGRFTHSSDVWSYGVTLWEMYTYGDQPYGNLPGFEVVKLLERDERLPQPQECSNAVYRLMLRCWHHNPNQRPTFEQLALHFSSGDEYVDVKPYLNTKG
ncbi:Serine-threonine/tyrosine-protein kinase catalytic domain [Trinorchestia longiramus]|nr:Serine-threonine/tyrosine-protein kinase catalytic domain [Trinorchestia longiramus]